MMDTIQGWVVDELCFGPLKPEEMPFEDYTVNPIVVKLKPTGAARVCINQSAPHSKPWHKAGAPSAVNSGVDKSDFPSSMGSTRTFTISLFKAGCPAEMIKIDWNQGMNSDIFQMLYLKGELICWIILRRIGSLN